MKSWLICSMLLLSSSVVFAQGYQGPTRIDFDERLIKGQTTQAGSVYIFERQPITLRSLVLYKRRFKPRIIRTVFDRK